MMKFTIKAYSVFAPVDYDEQPSVDFIPPKQRRRLSQNIRMSLASAQELGGQACRAVYATRYGEWGQTLKLLEEYSCEASVSPMGFGLSVHNAAGGLFSLINTNTLPYTLVSAGEDSFSAGLLEALTSLRKEPILYVYSDEKVPEAYAGVVAPYQPTAFAMLLTEGEDLGWLAGERMTDRGTLAFADFLSSGTTEHYSGVLKVWKAL